MKVAGHGRSGQALVETVLVLPVILLILFGIISLGLYANAANSIQETTREAARAAVIGDSLGCPGDSATAQEAAGKPPTVYGVVDSQVNSDGPWLSATGSSGALPLISYAAIIGDQTNPQENMVLVTVSYPYHPVLPIPGLLPSSLTLHTTYEMMVQVPQGSGATTAGLPSGSPYDETSQWTTPPPPTTNVVYLTQPGGC